MMKEDKSVKTVKFTSPLRYQGNVFFLILFLIIWLPLGSLLLLKNGYMETGLSKFYITYEKKWGWLFFWAIFFFPIYILLLIIHGVCVIEEKKTL